MSLPCTEDGCQGNVNISVVSHSRPAALSQTLLFAEMIGGHYSARQASLGVSLSLVPEGSHPAMLGATLVVLGTPWYRGQSPGLPLRS